MNAMIAVPGNLPADVARALAEDVGRGDLTAELVPAERTARAAIITRDAAILCGTPYVNETFVQLDPRVRLEWHAAEGAAVVPNQRLVSIMGPARALLTGERTALNFLQLLSATATAAHRFAGLLDGTSCRLLDTRKTLPGLRLAQKYAVRVGGGQNHRIGLFDGILIKENHIAAAGSIANAVAAARALHAGVPVEVEVENLAELGEAIGAAVDIAMLDDFSLGQMREAVALNRAAPEPVKLEASGGVRPETIRDIAMTGVDFVSVGSLTKHVRAVDLSMRFD